MKVLTTCLMQVIGSLPDPKTCPGDFYKVIVPEDLNLQDGMFPTSLEEMEKVANSVARILTFKKEVFSTETDYQFTRWVLEIGDE